MEVVKDEDRKRRMRQLEEKIQDPRSVGNVDCLLVSHFILYSTFTPIINFDKKMSKLIFFNVSIISYQ